MRITTQHAKNTAYRGLQDSWDSREIPRYQLPTPKVSTTATNTRSSAKTTRVSALQSYLTISRCGTHLRLHEHHYQARKEIIQGQSTSRSTENQAQQLQG